VKSVEIIVVYSGLLTLGDMGTIQYGNPSALNSSIVVLVVWETTYPHSFGPGWSVFDPSREWT
jgi:hypothetical protein